MLFRKLWRTMGLYKAQFISMVLMVALGVGMFIGFNMEWYSIDVNTSAFFEETHFADYRIISEKGFSEKEAESIKELAETEKASRFISIQTDVKGTKGRSLALTAVEDDGISDFRLMKGEEYDSASKNGIWLSDKYADANDVKLGDKMTLTYKGIEIKGEVKGLIKSSEYLICVRDETQLMPDLETYGYAYISPAMYEAAVGTDFYTQINVISDTGKSEFTEAVDDALGRTVMLLTKDENGSYSGASGEAEEGKTMGSIFPVLFLLIAVLTMVTTMHRIAAQEKTQIGTLKALGFKDRRILRHYTSYAFMVAVIGSAAGIGVGCFLAWYIMNPNGSMGTYMDMPEWKLCMPRFCVLIIIGLIIVMTLIGYLSVKKMLHGTAADALRPYTPKKMKKLLIEKTAFWSKCGFGVRWNLRDIMRHKTRTLMSMIGIIGCTLLMVGSMGMSDTMDVFLDMYYGDAADYSSCIHVADEASDTAREKLLDKYDGDYSCSISVQLEDKAVALDVYSVENGRVRFPSASEDGGFEKIGSSGAYVCRRIADEFDIEKGDYITVSPYGSDDEYRLRIAGITRSVSENIVISPEYADRLGIDYSIESIYTDTDKNDIDTDSSIASIQSKKSIMDSFDSFMEIMNMMVVVLIAAGALLGIIVLYNLGVMSYTERYREMATLKVVGFKDKKIGALLVEQNMWVTVIGIIIGIPAGRATLEYLLDAMASEYEMRMSIDMSTYLFSILLTAGVSLIVSLMVARKNKKIDMVEALKGAE
jgi:putative ABC transport system permease protein